MFIRNNLSVQRKAKVSATYFARSLNHYKLFAFAGKSPLHVAARSGSIEIVKLLLDRGADMEKADGLGKTFLVFFLLCCQVYLLFGIHLLFTGRNLNVQRKTKICATYFAGSLNHDKLFAFAGDSPLRAAVESGSIQIVKLLLDRGADIEKADEDGKTFLVFLLPCCQV